MSLLIRKADSFLADFEGQFAWYARNAGWEVARRYLVAVDRTLQRLAHNPGIGRVRRFRHPSLRGIRSYRVEPPFTKHLVFYRSTSTALFVERVVHGAREMLRELERPRAAAPDSRAGPGSDPPRRPSP